MMEGGKDVRSDTVFGKELVLIQHLLQNPDQSLFRRQRQ